MTPTYRAARSGTTSTHGSVSAMPRNLSVRALVAAAPQGATSPGPQCPNHSPGATKGWLAIVMATPRSFYDGSTGSPKGAASGEALAVSPSLSSARTACTLKGGCLSIATQGSYWLSSPHPLALSTASRPGIPATAETRSRAGTQGRRAERGAKARGEGHARTSPSNSRLPMHGPGDTPESGP